MKALQRIQEHGMTATLGLTNKALATALRAAGATARWSERGTVEMTVSGEVMHSHRVPMGSRKTVDRSIAWWNLRAVEDRVLAS